MCRMVNTRLLKAAIIEAGFTQKSLAEVLNMAENTLSAKINGKSKFDVDEATSICDILPIVDDRKKVAIFLAKASQIRDSLI